MLKVVVNSLPPLRFPYFSSCPCIQHMNLILSFSIIIAFISVLVLCDRECLIVSIKQRSGDYNNKDMETVRHFLASTIAEISSETKLTVSASNRGRSQTPSLKLFCFKEKPTKTFHPPNPTTNRTSYEEMFSAHRLKSQFEKTYGQSIIDYFEWDATMELSAMGAEFQQKPAGWQMERLRGTTKSSRGAYLQRSWSVQGSGAGVNIYVLDTPVQLDHQEYNGRVQQVYDSSQLAGKEDRKSCTSHGTHVMGLILGTSTGIAKQATGYSVVVAGCQGARTAKISTLVDGINWVTASFRKGIPTIMYLSAAGSVRNSESVQKAVEAAINNGIVVIGPAGNNNQDSCEYVPGSMKTVTRVGATTIDDVRAEFSNWGRCVSLFAPGASIVSSAFGVVTTNSGDKPSTSMYTTYSGTSMAGALAVGVAALYLEANPKLTSSDVRKLLTTQASKNIIQGDGLFGADNLLLSSLLPADLKAKTDPFIMVIPLLSKFNLTSVFALETIEADEGYVFDGVDPRYSNIELTALRFSLLSLLLVGLGTAGFFWLKLRKIYQTN